MQLSNSEENYLKVIYKLEGGGLPSVTTGAVAAAFGIQAPSVTDMIKKLAEKKMLVYEKSKGVQLTSLGKKMALIVIRRHRIWETFLVQTLAFGWEQVHELAEQLEHVSSDLLTNKLDEFLGYPKYDPHGDPIPDVHGRIISSKAILLNQGEIGVAYKLLGIREDSPEFLKYLDKLNLKLGSEIEIKSKESFDHSLQIRIDKKHNFTITPKAASLLNVVKI
jgi:DtxR family Mn-dependent transcriptional regulator